MSDKNIHVVSTPDTPDTWLYTPLWPTDKLHELVRATKLVYLDEQEVVDLMLKVRADYDNLYSKALYDLMIREEADEIRHHTQEQDDNR